MRGASIHGSQSVTVITLDDDEDGAQRKRQLTSSQSKDEESTYKPDKYHFKQADTQSANNFVPFSGKGNVLGSSSGESSIKKPRYH